MSMISTLNCVDAPRGSSVSQIECAVRGREFRDIVRKLHMKTSGTLRGCTLRSAANSLYPERQNASVYNFSVPETTRPKVPAGSSISTVLGGSCGLSK